MFQQQVYILNNVLMILDALCVVAAGYGAFYIKNILPDLHWNIENIVFALSILIVMIVNNYIMGKLRLYSDSKPSSYFSLLWSVFKAVFADFLILSAAIFAMKKITYSRLFLLSFAVLTFGFISIQRVLSHKYLSRISKKGFNIRKILVVGNTKRAKLVSEVLKRQLSWGHEIVGRLTIDGLVNESAKCLGRLEDLTKVLRNYAIDEVVFALNGDRSIDLMSHLSICKKMGIAARILPSLWNPTDHNVSVESCQSTPFLTVKVNNINTTGLLYKRILDLVGGVMGTLVFLILYPFVGVAVKLDSPGPVLFKQKRIGRNGRLFTLYKFRSMYWDADDRKQEVLKKNEMQGAMFKLKDDPRITRVGKWLRKTSIDEFPQFLNVLKGEMSLVGTRPPTPEEVEKYLTSHLRRLSGTPGITGLWQISGRNEINDFNKVVELDCRYLENWRFADDLKILFKTTLVMIKQTGAS